MFLITLASKRVTDTIRSNSNFHVISDLSGHLQILGIKLQTRADDSRSELNVESRNMHQK